MTTAAIVTCCIYTAIFVWFGTSYFYSSKSNKERMKRSEQEQLEWEKKYTKERLEWQETAKQAALDRKLAKLENELARLKTDVSKRFEALEDATRKNDAA